MSTNHSVTVFISLLICSLSLHAEQDHPVQFRARVTKLEPAQVARIFWRWGGEGLGGKPVTGEITRFLPSQPDQPNVDAAFEKKDDLDVGEIIPEKKPQDRIITEDETWKYEYLKPGTWSRPYPITTFKRSGSCFITFTLKGHQTGTAITGAEMEFEFASDGKAIKRFKVAGPDGPTFGIYAPLRQLGKDGKPTDLFAKQLGSLRHYIEGKQNALRQLPWIDQPVPKLYGILTDCNGYRPGTGYKCRTTDKETMLAEFEVLRLMGFNGTRGCPAFVMELIRNREGIGRKFNRSKIGRSGGFPISMVDYGDGRAPFRHPGDGCPYHPENIRRMPERVAAALERVREQTAGLPIHDFWGLTVDEIGHIFGGAPERGDHPGSCPYCREGFREFVRGDGRTLEDFGASSWEDIRSTHGYWAINFWEAKQELEDIVARAKKEVATDTKGALDVKIGEGADDEPDGEELESDLELEAKKGKKDSAQELIDAEARLRTLIWSSKVTYVPKEQQKLKLTPEGWDLLHYYSRRFNAEESARAFGPLQKALEAENMKKKKALARGDTDSRDAQRPWLYSYALRGNTFLMGGSTLGFFDFYRHADNAFVYETSNRDYRVWQWDSYLCDVGRSLSRFMGKRFGIYLKPHRGAPIQRALTAMARGVRMIYWYTYGPEWSKGDTWGGRLSVLEKVAWTTRLIAQAEEVTYDADWAVPAEVAIVRPRTAQFFSGSASWENGKWVYTALMHAHIPVDPLDEGLLMTEDLSRYKVIVICGDHLRRDAATKLVKWVEEGGTLYTCGAGMSRDERNRPLDDVVNPMFGLETRNKMESWASVPRYGATSLRAIRQTSEPPVDATVSGQAPLKGTFPLRVGREKLSPVSDGDVVASYADGVPAVIRHRYGKGTAWLTGFYSGMEYAWETMQKKEFRADKRAFVAEPMLAAGVRPVVDASDPLVEGVMLKNRQTGKLAVILINWRHKIEEEVSVRIRGAGQFGRAKSLATGERLTPKPEGEDRLVTLPGMKEGDILLLE